MGSAHESLFDFGQDFCQSEPNRGLKIKTVLTKSVRMVSLVISNLSKGQQLVSHREKQIVVAIYTEF